MAEQYHQAARTVGGIENLPSTDRISERFKVAFRSVNVPGAELRYGTTLAEGLWFWKRVLGSVFPTLPNDQLTELTNYLFDQFGTTSAWSPYSEVRNVLGSLRKRGVKLGLISNFDARGPDLLASLELSKFFDCVVFSSEVGYEKPDERIFENLVERLNGEPDRFIMVGNSASADLNIPESLGWETILHAPGSDDEWRTEVDSWSEILRFVEGCR